MVNFPCAPFFEPANKPVVKPRTAEQIVEIALTELAPLIKDLPDDGYNDTTVTIELGDPGLEEVERAFEAAIEGRGYTKARVERWTSEYAFSLWWDTPFSKLQNLCDDPQVDNETKYKAIGNFVSSEHAGRFVVPYKGIHFIDLDTPVPNDEKAGLTFYLLKHYNLRAFAHGNELYIFNYDDF